jgi:hypothetical protein
MNKVIPLGALLWVTVTVIVILLISGGWWFIGRMSVGTYRHALNHQEKSKDTLWRDIRTGCPDVNGGQILIGESSPGYVSDPLASSDKVYRYVVLDHAVLSSPTCLVNVVASARQTSIYPVLILF